MASHFKTNGAAKLVLCLSLVWMYTTYVVLNRLPENVHNDNGVHSIAKSKELPQRSPGLPSNSIRTPMKNAGGNRTIDDDDSLPYTIVHSLTTRFMLGQTSKPFLARARYLLFETFCHPTVAHQTALASYSKQDFFWFVLVDPGLDRGVLNDLQHLLSSESFPNGNAYLVPTDNPLWASDGVGVPGVDSYGAGFEEIARLVRDGSVQLLEGNATKLVRTLEETIEATTTATTTTKQHKDKPLLLIETMLDADDGLNHKAVEWIQDLAVSHSQHQEVQLLQNSFDHLGQSFTRQFLTLNNTWWLLCGTDHIEWHNRDVYRLTDKQYEQNGLAGGIVGWRHAPQYCASAGFTRVGLTSERSSKDGAPLAFPKRAYSNHALATEEFDRCVGDSERETANDSSAKTNANTNANTTADPWSQCFRRDFAGKPFCLKGRTVTSDSMDHMGLRNEDYRDLPWESPNEHPLLGLNESDRMWALAKNDFFIDPQKAQTASVYLRDHLGSIVQENREGRCAPGFPCREVADVAFKKMSRYVHALNKKPKQQPQQKA